MKSKHTKQCIQPKLRFPEFRDAGEWKINPVYKVCDVNPPNEGLPEVFIYIDLESVDSGNLVSKKRISRSDAPSRAQRLLQRNDVIYQIVRPYQKNNLFFNINDGEEYVASTGYAQLRAHESAQFLYQSIHTNTFVNKVIAKCTGSNYPAINSSDLAQIEIPIPEKAEQQKIADCLSSLDELIEAEDAKLQALQQHKKGLMLELFPAEGETIPKRRFPEFQSNTDWKIIELGSMSKIVRGGSPRPIDDYLTNNPEALNWLKIGDVDKESKYVTRTREKVVHSALNKSRKVNPGDLIMSNSMSFGRPYILKIKACIHDGWIAITEISKNVSLDYLYYYILSNSSQSYFMRSAAGSGVKNLNADIIKLLNIALPKLPEQKAIADCISLIDDLINAQSQEIDTLRDHKNGLMQQLFPVAHEV